ncbi:putative glycosyltransferase [Desulfocurvibacter africanus PCS]|uniref:Putative glycosyltransferase n=1 Tax=Desulfocurvibacter africanus PCS TaxID=1262666 RepID=M5PWR9_DESAF|nr:glycosyltransferase family A protein [Desulfocurvibacter africanus]EMG38430.1 putative glycosyltransferase [Desulfocurvibacter africanus PCS]
MGVELHICLLVTTRGRIDVLVRLLNSLVLQNHRHFHVILGDQNPTGFLAPLLASYRDTLRIERHPIPESSLSRARNLLIPHAHGDIIALTDDDCHYAPDCLSRVAKAFLASPEIGILCATPCETLQRGTVQQAHNTTRPISRYGIFRSCPSWVLFFSAAAFRSVGKFDENLGVGAPTPSQSGEETDFALRVMARGARAFRLATAHVFHDSVTITPAMMERTRRYGIGRMTVLIKHGFPLWFILANLLFPLAQFAICVLRRTSQHALLHWQTFRGRLQGLLHP